MTTDDEIRSAGHSKHLNRYKRGREKLTLAFSRFRVVRFVTKRYILQQKCLKG